VTNSLPGSRLRILQVILSRGFAGSERAAVETCNALCQQHDVAIIVRRDHRSSGGASICDSLDRRVQVFEVPAHWRTRAAVGAVIRQWRPEVVHSHLRRGTRYVAQLRPGVPHFATLHLALNGPHYLEVDGLVCISDWQLQTVPREKFAGRLLHIPNSLVPQPRVRAERKAELRHAAGAVASDFLIGGVGRLTQGKGFDVLIEAFRRAALPEARLVIVGEGSERRRLERLAAGAPVVFTGFRHDAKDWYQACDLFVSSSRSEPFGRVIVEALDAGTPVIATDALGPRDIAARYPLELVPAGDVEAMVVALRRAHGRPRARVAVDLSEFHIDRIAQSLLAAYESVLEPAVAPEPALPHDPARAAA
jgi:glycosyltransferase involved in cell wall biosynthesis